MMEVLQAIKTVLGLTLKDLAGPERTQDRIFGRVLFVHHSGMTRSELSKKLGKNYTTIMHYEALYDAYSTDSEFLECRDKVESML